MVRDDHERHVDEMRERVKTCETSTGEPMTMVYPTLFCDDAISRDAAIEAVKQAIYNHDSAIMRLTELPSVTQKSGKWIDHSDEGYVECPFCGHATNCEDDIDELHYCFYCGARMESNNNE